MMNISVLQIYLIHDAFSEPPFFNSWLTSPISFLKLNDDITRLCCFNLADFIMYDKVSVCSMYSYTFFQKPF